MIEFNADIGLFEFSSTGFPICGVSSSYRPQDAIAGIFILDTDIYELQILGDT